MIVLSSAEGIPAASAEMPNAVRSVVIGSCASDDSAVSRVRCALALAGRAAQGAGMLRRSGSVESTLASSRIAETPSTSAWWVLVYIATRPSRSPSTTCASHSGRSQASRWLCSRDERSRSSRTRPGRGSALCRTWCSMSKCSSSTHTSWPAVLSERCGRLRNSGAISSVALTWVYIWRA